MRPVALLAALIVGASAGVASAAGEEKPPPAPEPSRWILGGAVQSDLALMTGGGDLCGRTSQTSAAYSCFRADREQYVGTPAPGKAAPLAVSYGTTRFLLQVERVIVSGLTVGSRFGFAIGGGPTPSRGSPFSPLHFEARVAYWFGGVPSTETGLRGFVAVMGGLAQVDAGRRLEVNECRAGSAGCTPATNEQPGGPNPDTQILDAYKKTGQGFAGLGVGLYYSFVRGSGALLGVSVMQLFPVLGTTLSPSLGYVFHVP